MEPVALKRERKGVRFFLTVKIFLMERIAKC